MEETDSRSDRARIPDSARAIYNRIYNHVNANLEEAPFLTLKDVFMVAATVGYSKKVRKPLGSEKKETIRMEVFSEKDRDILKAIALMETQDIHVLACNPKELVSSKVLTIAEEYAHAGIYELRDQIIEKPGDALWNLVNFVKHA